MMKITTSRNSQWTTSASTSWDAPNVGPENSQCQASSLHRSWSVFNIFFFVFRMLGKRVINRAYCRLAAVEMSRAQVRKVLFTIYDIRWLTILVKKKMETLRHIEFYHSYLQTTSNIIAISYLQTQLNMCQLNFQWFFIVRFRCSFFTCCCTVLHLCQSILCWNCKPNSNLWKYKANFSNNNNNNKTL